MFHFHLSQIFFFQEKMKRALAKGAGQWEMETMGILKAESNKSIQHSFAFSQPLPHLCNAKPYICCCMFNQHCMSQYMLKSHVFSKQATPAASELLSNCLLKGSITVLYGEAQITTQSLGCIYFCYSFFLTLGEDFFCANRVGDPRTLLFPVRVMRALCLTGCSGYDKDFSAMGGKQKRKATINHGSSPMPMISK